MKQVQTILEVQTRGRGFVDITEKISSWVREQDIAQGLLTVFIKHTSASLIIQENADPHVLSDLEEFFAKTIKEDSKLYRHTSEGPDDMPAHIRCALTQTHLSIPIINGYLTLGEWQGVYVYEHRSRPHARSIVLHMLGAPKQTS